MRLDANCTKIPISTTEVKKALSTDAASTSSNRFKETLQLIKYYSADENFIRGVATNNMCDEVVIYEEKDKEIVEGVYLRAASMDQMINIILKSFEKSDSTPDTKNVPLLRIFFLMHQWLLDSQLLANLFFTRLESEPHGEDARRICAALRYWMQSFATHFDLDKSLALMIVHLTQKLNEWGRCDLQSLLDISKVPSLDWMRVTSVRKTDSPNLKASGKESLVFNKLDADQLANQLTVLEFKAFRRITFSDLKQYSISGSLKDCARLEKSIALFNGLCQWIQCLILNKTTPAERATVIARFVEVARQLHKQNNYNTLMAVVGGLSHSSIARLTKTNACLSQETQKTLNDFTELLSSSNNFSNYRRDIFQAEGFKIPILGIHLKDLILLHTALPDYIGDSLINFRKLCQLSHTFVFISECQLCTLPYTENVELCNTLRLSLDYHYTEEEIYVLSLAREPRNSVSPSTPTKPVVFADWIAGLRPPDPETLKKHVNDMVEAVFKVYDHDKDGSISQNEFNQISENFPFIDSFTVLDADNDGIISRAEMTTYFMRANCNALRNSFKHDFHETTYFKLTFCAHCTGLLWGLIKQGWKCRLCAINAHKHCKDLVVAECRSGRHPPPRTGSVNEYSSSCLSINSSSTSASSAGFNVEHAERANMLNRHHQTMRKKRHNCTINRSTQTGPAHDVHECNEEAQPTTYNSNAQDLMSMTNSTSNYFANDLRVPEISLEASQLVAGTTPGTAAAMILPPLADVSEFEDDIDDEADYDEDNEAEYNRMTHYEFSTELTVQKIVQDKSRLLKENQMLRDRLDGQAAQINLMRNHIENIRQHTISFILSQMETFNIQRDSEV